MLHLSKPVAALAVAALAAAPSTATATATPHIAAKPKKVMVNTSTTLKGKGFPADTAVELIECGRTFWLAPAFPCLDENEITVQTNGKGKFETQFEAKVCPEAERTKEPTQVVCYVGEPEYGEDTGMLVGAAKLLVSYP